MPPNTDRPNISLNFKYPSNREKIISGEGWLDAKREDDETEDLWRIHDNLYNVSDFINSHPGGPSWLELTKGTDITEAFEAHHISSIAEEVLKKYYVRKAKKPRNSPFTFEEDGFYRTLKRNVRPILKTIPKNSSRTSDIIIDSLCAGTFISAICASAFSSYVLGIISAFLLTFTVIAAHNYFHRRDNLRMYYFNLCLMDFRQWRITHALSHHLFPNTINDLEISVWEPMIQYLPVKKSIIIKSTSYISIIVLWLALYLISYLKKLVNIVKTKKMEISDLIPFTLPIAMYLFSGATLLTILKMWLFIVIVASFIFGVIGFNAAHHHPDIFHEGDAPRSKTLDWGIHQLDAVCDRHEITGNSFLVLTNFGDHALHHLFPTMDHTALQYLYPVLQETMKQFNVDLQMKSQMEMIIGQFQQLTRESPNVVPPGRSKN